MADHTIIIIGTLIALELDTNIMSSIIYRKFMRRRLIHISRLRFTSSAVQ